jgi:5'-nucleotidase
LPLILLTNDDGYDAPGLQALKPVLRKLGTLVTVSPLSQQSATSHSITLLKPLFVKAQTDRGDSREYTVEGTPIDCVKLALHQLLPQKPDMVVSGINLGANTGINIFYSGTVSAALEGAINGIPSLALSLDSFVPGDFSRAAALATKFGKLLLAKFRGQRIALNVNVPNLPKRQQKGIRLTRQDCRCYREEYERRIDPRRRTYFWMTEFFEALGRPEAAADPGCDWPLDSQTLKEGFVSVTPLEFDLTAYPVMDKCREHLKSEQPRPAAPAKKRR